MAYRNVTDRQQNEDQSHRSEEDEQPCPDALNHRLRPSSQKNVALTWRIEIYLGLAHRIMLFVRFET